MNFTKEYLDRKDMSLIPPTYVTDRAVLDDPAGDYTDENRLFQGIPGIECTPKGTYYMVFYTGGQSENIGNFLLLFRADDPHRFGKPFMAVVPPDREFTRCFDPCLWVDPLGRLNLFWAQSFGNFDGRLGVWRAVCEDPDSETPRFDPPERIANGIMMNKPTVVRGGSWLLPCAIWAPASSELNDIPEEKFTNVYRSDDNGKTFRLYGHADCPRRGIDEHMIYERSDGSLRMLIRTSPGIGESTSYDGGKTWSDGKDSGLGGPDSRFCVRKLKSGRILLVNHYDFRERDHLTAMLSEDDGETWKGFLLLDERARVSYPDAAQSPDGMINIIYDWNRKDDKEILLARVTEEDILAGRLTDSRSELKLLLNKATGTPDKQ